jgi:hypothetical protein
MIAEQRAFARQATEEELARLEASRTSLRRSARWVAAVGLVLPTVLAVVVTASTLMTFPGSWLELLLGLLLGYVAIFAVFTGGMLLNETGHVLASSRRLERDAAGGFGVVRERGEVKWGKSSYVAVVGGRRLFSPYFTELASVPGFWRHFDRLMPGRYVFELLPESGLVLHAEPAAHAEHSAHIEPAERHARAVSQPAESALDAALLAAFRNRPEDRALNRVGRASGAQRWRLFVTYAWLLILLPGLGIGAWVSRTKPVEAPTTVGWFGVLVLVAFSGFVLQLLVRVVLDLFEGRVESKVGRTTFRFGKTDATGSIDGRSFTLSNKQARALFALPRYRVYFFRRTRQVAGAEAAGIPRPAQQRLDSAS